MLRWNNHITSHSRWASIVSPVNNISNASFLGTERDTATAGVEQNNPMLALKMAQDLKKM